MRLLQLLLVAVTFDVVQASHFRGAIITWKPGTQEGEVIIDYRISWRRSYGHSVRCTSLGDTAYGQGQLTCMSRNCGATSLGQLSFVCTDISSTEDWSSGRGSIVRIFPVQNSKQFEFGFTGIAWIDTLNYGAGGSWRLIATADLTVRNDTNEINSSPTAEISPIIRLQYGCSHTIKISVSDPDDDVVRCFEAQADKDQCGSICNGFPNSILNTDTCTITYSANYQTGWYAVALQVQDYVDVNSSTPLSSIPVQFLVYVYQSSETCNRTTVFVDPTPPDDACIGVPFNETFAAAIVARVASTDASITEIKTVSPVGLSRSELQKVNGTDWRLNFTYTPRPEAAVANTFCFVAKESSGVESDERCIAFLNGVTEPGFVDGAPKGKVYSRQRQWTAMVDSNFQRPSRQTYIRLYNGKDKLVEKIDASDSTSVFMDFTEKELRFSTTTDLIENEKYYFLLDFGVLKGTSHCGADSTAIEDPNFWRIRIRDETPPSITLSKMPSTTNETAKLEWNINEPANCSCSLIYPGGAEKMFECNRSWTGINLGQGIYTLQIKATDLEGNSADLRHTWFVDTTPPTIEFSRKPLTVSNENPANFKWTCTQPCNTRCTVHGLDWTADCGRNILLQLPKKSNVTYTFQLEAEDNVGNKASVNYTWTTDFDPPSITLCNGLSPSLTVDCNSSLRPEDICNGIARDNMDLNPKLSYVDENSNSCGIMRIWTATDKAGNTAKLVQNIKIQTNKSMIISNVPGPVSVACGGLDQMTDILESMFEVNHPCGLGVHIIHKDNSSDICDTVIKRTWTISDNCGNSINIHQLLKVRRAVKPLAPDDGQTGVDVSTYLQWYKSESISIYEIYIWERDAPRTNLPNAIVTTNYFEAKSLKPGTRYRWQVVMKYINNETFLSPIWVFETRDYADLLVQQIEVPHTAFTNHDCTVKWTVVNVGGIATQTLYWTDAVFLSWDENFNERKRVATVTQKNILYTNDSYSSTATFRLDKDKFGPAYIFVKTDYRNYISELDKENNLMRSTSLIDIKLSPPPDLQVTSIWLPEGTRVFSGTLVSISWTVKNVGLGPTNDNRWTDRILWPSITEGETTTILSNVKHFGSLPQNGTYTQTAQIKMPEFITGDYMILIQTDAFDEVYEYLSENNTNQIPLYVILTLPPDIELETINTSTDWESGEIVKITWTVANKGNDSPKSQMYWLDYVVLESKFERRYVGSSTHYGILLSNEKYSSTVEYYVSPELQTDVYNLTVISDFRNNLFENQWKANNKKSTQIKIKQALPDLQVQNFTLSPMYMNKTYVNVHYIVVNKGKGKTLSEQWTDTLFVGTMGGQFKFALKRFLIEEERKLAPNATYNQNKTIELPFTLYGNLQFEIKIDDVYSSTGDTDFQTNSYLLSNVEIRQRTADFVLENIKDIKSIVSGEDVYISYTVTNKGSLDVERGQWHDRISITDLSYNDSTIQDMDIQTESNIDLKQNDSYNKTVKITFPISLSGTFFANIWVNWKNSVFEGDKTSNNKGVKMFSVQKSPTADLMVKSVTAEITGTNLLSVEWSVYNTGNSLKNVLTWYDTVLLKRYEDPDIILEQISYRIESSLEAHSSYTMRRNIFMPLYVTGNIYVCVQTNAIQSVYESGSDDNNIHCQTMPVFIKKLQEAKLSAKLNKIISKNENGLIVPGSSVSVEFVVENVGELQTVLSSWTDSIYISDFKTNSIEYLKIHGTRVKDIVHAGILKPKESYSTFTTFKIPFSFNATPIFFVLANNTNLDDIYDDLNDEPISNPQTEYIGLGSYSQHVDFSYLLPNLRILSNSTLKYVQGGLPITLEYDLTNTGNVSTSQIWYDSAYLSQDLIFDAFDTKLASVPRRLKIDPSESVTVNITFRIPLDLDTKGYYLTIIADSRDDIFEKDEEDNSVKFVINVEGRASTDIAVSNVVAPNIMEKGTDVSISWRVTNKGTRKAKGYKCDSVYLSEDIRWDISDAQIGKPVCSFFELEENGTSSENDGIKSEVPDVASALYNTLVKSRSNILDFDLENNIAISSNKSDVKYMTMAIDDTSRITLTPYGSVSLRIVNISNEESLTFNISSDSRESFNSLYVKGGSPATLYEFDKSSNDPNSPDQFVFIPNSMYSEYYILIVNTGSISSLAIQNIAVSVKYARFEILDVVPRTLLVGAETTFHITGTLIPHDSLIELRSSSNTYKALKAYIFSSTSAYATFHIDERDPSSVFQLFLVSNSLNKTAQFNENISVKSGINGYLVYSVETPSRLRIGETGIITINLQNAGDSDIYVPLVAIEASDHGSIRLIDNYKIHLFQQNYFVFGSTDTGPAGIMPPKSHSQLKFETKQNETLQSRQIKMTLNTSTLKQDISTPNPFIRQKDNLRPSHYKPSEWDQIWSNFIAATGNSSLSFSRKVSDILNEMSLGGRYIKDVDDVIRYLLEDADAPYTGRILERKSDLLVPSDEEVSLIIDRYLSARIGTRTQASRLGKGWILPLWDTKLKQISGDELTLTMERVDTTFIKLDNNSFIDKNLGVVSFSDKDLIYSPYKERKEFHFDRDTFALTEITSLVDDSYLKLEYKETLLVKIRHSSGAFVTVTYDSSERIQTMQLQNSSGSMYNREVLFVYDLDSGMLSEVRQNGESTRYVYFENSTLKYIINHDSSRNQFEYSNSGHLICKKLMQMNKEVSSLQYSYRPGGVVYLEKKPENKTFELTFNEDGEVILIQRKGFLPAKTLKTSFTEIQYIGDMIVTKRSWSRDGNSLLIEDGNGDSLKPYFNNKNQLIGFFDGTGHEYKIRLNENGSLDSIHFPDGSRKRYNYTQNGHTVVTQSNGKNDFYYNGRKQLIRKDIGNGSTYVYNYDENGKLTSGENVNGKIDILYAKDKVRTVAYPDVSVTYSYNEKGLLSSLSTSEGYSVNYTYNDFNKIELVTDKSGKQILKAEYDETGKLVKKLLGNNATTTFSYDSITGLLKNMTNYFPNGTIASYFYCEYSLHLSLVAVRTQYGLWKFKYDRAGQVVSMTGPSESVTKYTYDKSKNRIRVSIDNVDFESEVNNMNQLNKYRKRSYSYDRNGNMNFRSDGSSEEFFSYDEDNKLISYKSNSTVCVFRYDALDNLHSKICNNVTTRYIVNPRGNYGSDIIQQVTSKNGDETLIQYYHGGGEIGLIAARYGDGHMNYFMYDPVGTVQGILNENGELLNSYHIDWFGQVIRSSETFTSSFTFNGQWGVVDFKEIQDMYFMRSRFYNSFTGRFVSIDSFGLKAHSKNLYAYCANNPVYCNDPNGNFWIIAAGATVGVIDYALSTPYEDWTWGGSAGSVFSAGVKGAVVASGAGLFTTVGASIAADIGAGWLSKKIDNEPYSYKDTANDFANSLRGQAEGRLLGKTGTRIKRVLQGLCQLIHYFMNPTPNTCGVPKDDLKKTLQDFVRWIFSFDPNDIVGPSGFGAAKFIDKKSSVMYKIRFENEENATAPAQRVYIEHPYSEHLDPRSFKLEGFGFGNFSKQVNSKALRENVNLTDNSGLVLRVFAGLDLAKGIILWEFQSLDPETGEAPLDPGLGFLPPNNGTSGQGYVTFSMQPKEEVEHLSTIHANASIFFDQNDPIDTPNIFNTIDSTSPVVNGSVINGTESSDSITISFEAFDSGSGVKHIDLFKKEENGFSVFISGLTDAIYVLPLQPGSLYSLVAVGIDHVGNQMDFGIFPPDIILNITTSQETECQCSGNGNCSYGTNLCNCEDGFYGPNCNSTKSPPEPPVLELKSRTGIVNQSIELMISARNVSGSLEEMEIFISGFNAGTVFSAGDLIGNDTLRLSYREFGLLYMTTQQSGQIKLNILVVQTSGTWNISRSNTLTVKVYDSHHDVDIRLQGCFTVYNDLRVVLLNSTVVLNDKTESSSTNISNDVHHTTLLTMPTEFYPVNVELNATDSVYKIKDNLVDVMFKTDNVIAPFNVTVDVSLEYTDLPPLTYSRTFQIEDFCDGECQCSGNGNCSYGTNLCNCEDGFYGPNCNSTKSPPEPPVLELKSRTGIVNQSIELMISARNVSGSLEEMEIFISGFNAGTVFSAGDLIGNDTLRLSYREFGLLYMTTQQSGQIKLNILVVQTYETWNISRSNTLTVKVYDSHHDVDIRLQGCFTVYNDLRVVLLNSTVVLNDKTESSSTNISNDVHHTTLLTMPTEFYPVNVELNATDSVYKIKDNLVDVMFKTDNVIAPFNVTVDVSLEYTDLPPLTYSRTFQIEDFCDGECQCSGNGNCNYGTNLCNCEDGFYGPNCNSTKSPPEPPVLELKSRTGIVNQSIELMISARNVSGSLEEMEIFISGFNAGTVFSAGDLIGNDTLRLSYREFGLLYMTTQQSGQIKLNILVVQTSGTWNISRSNTLTVKVYDSHHDVDIRLQGCFTVYNDLRVVLLNSTVVLNDKTESSSTNISNDVPHTTLLTMPIGFYPVNVELNGTGSVYKIKDTFVDAMFKTDNVIVPFNVTDDVSLEYTPLPPLTYSRKFQIEDFCDGECDLHKYGIRCDGTCQCNWQNTIKCDRFTGACKCQPKWEGLTCSESACEGYNGQNCEGTCNCVQDNTLECEKTNGTCTCLNGWTGSACETDVDECENTSICDDSPNTACQNNIPGYDCLCRRGYEQSNGLCVAIKYLDENKTVTILPNERSTLVTIIIDEAVKTTDNFEVEDTYQRYVNNSIDMLSMYYENELGSNFIKVIIVNIRSGSLIIEHYVISKNTEEGSQDLAVAVVKMKTENSLLTFDGEYVSVESVSLNETEVTDVCGVFQVLYNCTTCVTDQGKPTCRNMTSAPETDEGLFILIIAASAGVLIGISITVACCVKKMKKMSQMERVASYNTMMYRYNHPYVTETEVHEIPPLMSNTNTNRYDNVYL